MDNAELNESTNEKPLRWGAVAAGIGVGFIGALLCLSVLFILYTTLRLNVDFANPEDVDALGEKLEQALLQDKYALAALFFSIAGLFSFIGGYVAGKIGKNAPVLNAAVMAFIPSAFIALLSLPNLLAVRLSFVWPIYLYLFGCCAAALLGGYAASKRRSSSRFAAALKARRLSLKAMTLGWLSAFFIPIFLYMTVAGVYLLIDLHDHPSGWAALEDPDYTSILDIGSGAFTLASLALFTFFESISCLFAALGGYLAGRIGRENPVGNAVYVGAILTGLGLLFLAFSVPFGGFTGWSFLYMLTAGAYCWMAVLGGKKAEKRIAAQVSSHMNGGEPTASP